MSEILINDDIIMFVCGDMRRAGGRLNILKLLIEEYEMDVHSAHLHRKDMIDRCKVKNCDEYPYLQILLI